MFGFLGDSTNWQRITKVILGMGLMVIGAATISFTSVLRPTLTLFNKAGDAVAENAQLANIRAPNNPR